MLRLRYPLFVVLGLFVACGGKLLVDENRGGDHGAGGSVPVLTGASGSSGSNGTAGGYTAGFYDTGGAYGAGGVYVAGSGGFLTTGVGGFSGPCGPTLCPAGTQCCNPQCGVCVAYGLACPAIACGGSAGSGFGGSVGTAGAFPGGCGTPDSCLARIPGPLRCANEQYCLCKSCMCEANTCESDPGCQQIWQCALKLGCTGKSCYAPQMCQPIIDKIGLGSLSMATYLKLDACEAGSGCAATCTSVVDAGACGNPPPAVGGGKCTAMSGPSVDECSWSCSDSLMNSFVSKCSGTACSCYYNGSLTCSCKGGIPRGSACGDCCPSMGWTR